MRAFNRLLCRAALFFVTMPLLIIRSITGTASLKAAVAAALSPASQALTTPLILVRISERNPMLCLRVFSAWRARFLACLMFATGFFRVLRSESRVLFVPGPVLSMTTVVPRQRLVEERLND